MTWRTVVIAWGVAALLGTLAWLTRPTGPASAVPTGGGRDGAANAGRSERLEIDPAAVTALEISAPGLGSILVERSTWLGEAWVLTRRGPDDAGLWQWPGDGDVIAGLLRRVATSELRTGAAQAAPKGEATRVVFSEGTRRTELLIAGSLLGGRVDGTLRRPGTETGVAVVIAGELAESLRLDRIASYRDPAPMRRRAGGPRRAEVIRRDAAGEARWVIERSLGAWSLAGPSNASKDVDTARAQAWLDGAASLRETAAFDLAAADQPQAGLVIELHTPLPPTGDGVARTLVQRVAVVAADGTAVVSLEERAGTRVVKRMESVSRFDPALLGRLLGEITAMEAAP